MKESYSPIKKKKPKAKTYKNIATTTQISLKLKIKVLPKNLSLVGK
jgi:hypothetical protein